MVDIGTNGITVDKSDLCKDSIDQINDLQRVFDTSIRKGSNFGKDKLFDAIKGISDAGDQELSNKDDVINNAKGPAEDVISNINSIKDRIANGEILEGSGIDVGNLVECLSGLNPDNFKLPLDIFDGINTNNAGRTLYSISGQLLDTVGNLIDDALTPLEKAVTQAADHLKKLLDINALDNLLQLSRCLQDCNNGQSISGSNVYQVWCTDEQSYVTVFSENFPTECPNDPNHTIDRALTKTIITKLQSDIDIEESLSSVGMTLNGDIDWTSSMFSGLDNPISENMKTHFNDIQDFKNGIKTEAIELKDFSPLPEIPKPSIPKYDNPLKNLPFSEKMGNLF